MPGNASAFTIREIDSASFESWDRFVLTTPAGALFNTSRWARLIESVFGRRFRIITAQKDNHIYGGMLIWPKTYAGIPIITHPPATRYQGILLRNSQNKKPSGRIAQYHAVMAPLIDYLKKHYAFIDMTLPPLLDDTRPFQWRAFEVQPTYTYRFPVKPFDDLKQQFSQALRRKLNLAEKADLRVYASKDTTKLAAFIRQSYAYHQLAPPIPYKLMPVLFNAILDAEMGELCYLSDAGQDVAGLLVLHDERSVYAYFSGMDVNRRKQNDTEYLHAKILDNPDFVGKTFDFLGCNTPAFEQFKRSFGGELQPHFKILYYRNAFIRTLTALKLKRMQKRRGL